MNVSNVEGLLAQMRAMTAIAQGIDPVKTPAAAGSVDFSKVLKNSLDNVAKLDTQAENLQKAFVLGDDRVSLSDTMIAMQKADIAFQTSVQVRNKFVAAYNEVMNMQV